jgi:hypothetical protein
VWKDGGATLQVATFSAAARQFDGEQSERPQAAAKRSAQPYGRLWNRLRRDCDALGINPD